MTMPPFGVAPTRGPAFDPVRRPDVNRTDDGAERFTSALTAELDRSRDGRPDADRNRTDREVERLRAERGVDRERGHRESRPERDRREVSQQPALRERPVRRERAPRADDTGGADATRADDTGGADATRADDTGGADATRTEDTGGTDATRADDIPTSEVVTMQQPATATPADPAVVGQLAGAAPGPLVAAAPSPAETLPANAPAVPQAGIADVAGTAAGIAGTAAGVAGAPATPPATAGDAASATAAAGAAATPGAPETPSTGAGTTQTTGTGPAQPAGPAQQHADGQHPDGQHPDGQHADGQRPDGQHSDTVGQSSQHNAGGGEPGHDAPTSQRGAAATDMTRTGGTAAAGPADAVDAQPVAPPHATQAADPGVAAARLAAVGVPADGSQALPPTGLAAPSAAPTAPAAAPPAPAAPAAPAPPPATQLATHITPLRLEADGVHRLTVHLHPVDLGPVQVVAEIRDGAISVQLSGSTDAGHESLRHAMDDLKRELQEAGFSNCSLDLRQGTAGQPGPRPQYASAHPGRGAAGATDLPPAPELSTPPRSGDNRRLDLHV